MYAMRPSKETQIQVEWHTCALRCGQGIAWCGGSFICCCLFVRYCFYLVHLYRSTSNTHPPIPTPTHPYPHPHPHPHTYQNTSGVCNARENARTKERGTANACNNSQCVQQHERDENEREKVERTRERESERESERARQERDREIERESDGERQRLKENEKMKKKRFFLELSDGKKGQDQKKQM